jgi:hypothetical protein
MGFSAGDLSVLAYANGFTHWHYRTADRLADLVRDEARAMAGDDGGYFAGARELLRAGDQLTVNLQCRDGSIHLAQLVVSAISPDGRVRLAPV